MSCVGLATRPSLGYLQMVERWQLSACAVYAIQLGNRPSIADEVLEEVLSMEDEREPISKVSSWNLATRALLENREFPVW